MHSDFVNNLNKIEYAKYALSVRFAVVVLIMHKESDFYFTYSAARARDRTP